VGAIGAAILIGSMSVSIDAIADTSAAALYTHQTAPTQYVNVEGARLAYRRFGKQQGVPLLFIQHFGGNLDNWDPKVTDGLAKGREVILFDSAGVASSSGEVQTTIEGTAHYAIGLVRALGLKQVDVLGFSMGSFVAQETALEQPDLVRRLILLGSAPRAGVGMATLTPEFQAKLAKKRVHPDDLLLDVFFTRSEASQAAGQKFIKRLQSRQINRDVPINDKVAPAQAAAINGWGAPCENADAYLKNIKQPVLIVDGSNDTVFYTVNAFNLQQKLPHAQLIVYPDADHGAQYQYPDLFVQEASLFLSREAR
jgi:pimeloyl-ACP methyl ester carboxylesterase